ncbi:hypothetical protein [Marivirga tractuosa]|nr:hypothetical protein [Marivirga tractuosa]
MSLNLCLLQGTKEKSLFIIADKNESSVKYFPKILRYENEQIADVCFETKDVFLFSSFCFKIEAESNIEILDLNSVEGDIWHFEDFNKYVIEYFDEEKYSCETMFENYKNIFILIPKGEKYEMAKVEKCHTFEISHGRDE